MFISMQFVRLAGMVRPTQEEEEERGSNVCQACKSLQLLDDRVSSSFKCCLPLMFYIVLLRVCTLQLRTNLGILVAYGKYFYL